jgi:hypothetical protein
MKKKIILAFIALILVLVAFTGGLLLGVSTTRQAKEQPLTTAPPAATPTGQFDLGIEASQPAPMRTHWDGTVVRAGAWEQIEAATLCKSPSQDSLYILYILVDPLDALAEIWLLTCPEGEDEAYRVVYTPTVSGTTTIVTRMARP